MMQLLTMKQTNHEKLVFHSMTIEQYQESKISCVHCSIIISLFYCTSDPSIIEAKDEDGY